MVQFTCTPCNYQTASQRGYYEHLRTRKHINNKTNGQKIKKSDDDESIDEITPDHISPHFDTKIVENDGSLSTTQCEYCLKVLARKDSLLRHLKSCKEKTKRMKYELKNARELIKEKDDEIEKLKLEHIIKEKDKELEKKSIEVEYLKRENKIREETSQTVNKNTTNILKYATMHFKNVKNLDSYKIMMLDEETPEEEYVKIIDDMLSQYYHNNLHKYIADFIILHYQTDKVAERSFHNTDTDRQNFIVFQENWLCDKKGIKITENIINPILSQIKHHMTNYITKGARKAGLFTGNRLFKNMNDMKTAADINIAIEDNSLCHDILKILAPFFHLDLNNKLMLQN